MKRHILALALALLAPGATAFADKAPFTVEEVDRHGKVHEVKPPSKEQPRPLIVDSNSTVRVVFDPTVIREKTGAESIAKLTQRLQALQRIVEKGLEAVKQVRLVVQSLPPDALTADRAKLDAFFAAFQQLPKIKEILDAAGPEGAARIRGTVNSAIAELPSPVTLEKQYATLFRAVADEAEATRRELAPLLTNGGASVQVTFTTSRDLTRPDEVVRGNALALTQAEIDQLNGLGHFGASANRNGLQQAVRDEAQAQWTMIKSFAKQLADDTLKQLREAAQSAYDKLKMNPNYAELAATAKSILDQEQALSAAIQALPDAPPASQFSTGAGDFLGAMTGRLAAVANGTTGMLTAIKKLRDQLGALPQPPMELQMLAQQLEAIEGKVKSKLLEFAQKSAALMSVLRSLGIASDALTEVTVVVVTRTLEELDKPAELDLKGRRLGGGDEVKVEVALVRTDPVRQEPLGPTYRIHVYDVLPHLNRTVLLIYAQPQGRQRYNFAPSYSILRREGSRKSVARNELWNFGYGANIAALDFDKNDTPELGIGPVLSFLGDHLQAGYAYNINRRKPYWFFGLRIPLPFLNGGIQ